MSSDIGQSKGHEYNSIKDNERVSVRSNVSRNIGAFLVSDQMAFVILKAEKLATAVYLVSGLLSDSEPLKWSIRKIATEVLSDIDSIAVPIVSDSQKNTGPIENTSSKIFQTTSILRVAWMGGLVSKMNYEILTSEYVKLNDFLIKNFSLNDVSKNVLNQALFSSRELSILENRINSQSPDADRLGEQFSFEEELHEKSIENKYERRDFVKDISSKGHLLDKEEFVANKKLLSASVKKVRTLNEIVVGSVSDRNIRERHDKIILAMSPGISYSVSEIISIIGKGPDTSGKTIQRDLQHLVSIGRLKKTGERRWSRYSLS